MHLPPYNTPLRGIIHHNRTIKPISNVITLPIYQIESIYHLPPPTGAAKALYTLNTLLYDGGPGDLPSST